jgi:protein SCO1
MFVLRIIRWAAWALVAVAILVATGIAVGWLRTEWLGQSPLATVTTSGVPAVGGPLSLVNHRGERAMQDTFKGKPTAYVFGFTHCPEVCPTTLFGITQHPKELRPDGDRLNVAFVTLDPERDRPQRLKTYFESFDPRIVALTGTLEELATAAKAFCVSYRKVLTEGGDYTMEHPATMVVTDAQGEFVSLIDYHEDAATALSKLRRAIRGSWWTTAAPSARVSSAWASPATGLAPEDSWARPAVCRACSASPAYPACRPAVPAGAASWPCSGSTGTCRPRTGLAVRAGSSGPVAGPGPWPSACRTSSDWPMRSNPWSGLRPGASGRRGPG